MSFRQDSWLRCFLPSEPFPLTQSAHPPAGQSLSDALFEFVQHAEHLGKFSYLCVYRLSLPLECVSLRGRTLVFLKASKPQGPT